MRKYIRLTEYNKHAPTVIVFVDDIQGLVHAYDEERRKNFTEVITAGYVFLVVESIEKILRMMREADAKGEQE